LACDGYDDDDDAEKGWGADVGDELDPQTMECLEVS